MGERRGWSFLLNSKGWGYYLSTWLNMQYSEILEKPEPLVALKTPGDVSAPDLVV